MMEIKTLLEQERSKPHILYIADYIGNSQKRFDVLIEIIMKEESPLPQRAAWVLRYAAEPHPHLLLPHISAFIDILQQPVHDSLKRSITIVLQLIEIPEEYLGKLVDVSFQLLDNPKEAIAIRANAIDLLYKICKKEPALMQELRLVVEAHLEHASAGFKAKARKVLVQR